MSALIHDSEAEPPLRRRAETSQWQWPDRHEVTPPSMPAGRPLREPRPVAPRWSAELPERAWPPLPEPERVARPVAASGPVGSDADPAGRLAGGAVSSGPVPTAYAPGGGAGAGAGVSPGVALPSGPGAGRVPSRYRAGMAPGPEPLAGMAFVAAHPAARGARITATPAPLAGSARAAALDWGPAGGAAPAMRHDPSPSRLAYRLNRLWLTPLVRHFVRFGLPLLLLSALAGGWLASDSNRAAIGGWAEGLRQTVQNQPMFQVTALEVDARSPEVVQGVTQLLGLSFPLSSWDLDLAALRERAETLDAVAGAWLQVRSGGVLEVRITERVPAMVWRNGDGLELVDASGHRVAWLANRAGRADLPLIAGDGAPDAIAEAQALITAAAPLQGRMRGLVRIGKRRWDLVLDRGQRIQLPASGAVAALERVVALSEGAQQLLSRDVVLVDMRNPARPTLRLSPDAMTELTRNRTLARGAPRR